MRPKHIPKAASSGGKKGIKTPSNAKNGVNKKHLPPKTTFMNAKKSAAKPTARKTSPAKTALKKVKKTSSKNTPSKKEAKPKTVAKTATAKKPLPSKGKTNKAAAQKKPVKPAAVKSAARTASALQKTDTKKAVAKKPVSRKDVRKPAVSKKDTPTPIPAVAAKKDTAPKKAEIPQKTDTKSEKKSAEEFASSKKRHKNNVRPSQNIYFSMEDVDAFLERKKNNAEKPEFVQTVGTKVVSVSKPVKAQVVAAKRPKPAIATLADILGLGGVQETPAITKLADNDIPRKWKKFYNRLVELREHYSKGVKNRSDEVLKKSIKEDSGDLSSYGEHLADIGSESYERDLTFNMLSNDKNILSEIEGAIQRIKNGTYGICEVTGAAIPEDRLMSIPFTRYTKEGQERKELENKRKKSSQHSLYDIPGEGSSQSDEDDSSHPSIPQA